ncbi:D-lactate dehydrogenase [Microbulbifer elongatus]|uniref:Quinone-dependent D-lactate dehydrogenase n=1 Tax=Microbulbifer elongatus TaxID=86173 RepID=A0ABT1P465_9GAMM|nr:D-lactate dehydrogenase [Microbulbifer elongatus]MCQ3830895.1 D-lactate dehydrogenase [Microbulbifer elongatus]
MEDNPAASADVAKNRALLQQLEQLLGHHRVISDAQRNEHYRTGFRSGEGSAVAVVFPETLMQLWHTLEVCVEAGAIIIMQAANTGLTEGSTPNGHDYDRPIVVINTLQMNSIHLLGDGAHRGEQIVALPGATLHSLEKLLAPLQRSPHSEIGSSCLGASIVGGIANNSGGALCQRGPAYTELAVYAQVNADGHLQLINHLGIDLGETPQEILTNLENGTFFQVGKLPHPTGARARMASDRDYVARVQDVDADSPARFNADPRRLFEASGCAGKVAVFAVRLDTFPIPERTRTFYIGSNDADVFARLRRGLLTELPSIPLLGEYLHRDMFDLAADYGKDNFYTIEKLGTRRMPRFFALKGRIDAWLEKQTWAPRYFSDRLLQRLSRLLPQHLPERMLDYREKYQHHLIVKIADDSIEPAQQWLQGFFAHRDNTGDFFACDAKEASKAMLHRFVSAGAAMRYQAVHCRTVGELLPLDIALRRNDMDWEEKLPAEIADQLEYRLYYGHFLCNVFHQDYILKKDADPAAVKKAMLKLLDSRGARYPAEHNVGHLYQAPDAQTSFFEQLDPTNTFNPGIGKTDKHRRCCNCG